ncbi:MAG TPA: hypothetical protein VJQ83_04975 [Tepidiformaceae bacterium]|nr:hypothetical protein [Tepidiformaceae bacterium]
MRTPATSLRNIGPGCTKQYGADVHLGIHPVVTFLDDDVAELLRQHVARNRHVKRQTRAIPQE